MKKWLLVFSTILSFQWAMAQNEGTPAYQRFPTLPPIDLLQPDSSILTKEKLKKEPTIIMYFSPTCDHCQHQWEDMVKHMDELKSFQIIMATYQPFEEMVDFYNKQKIASYPNIKMGRDTKFTLPPFYRIASLPYQALYDKHGKLVTTYGGNVKIETMVKALEKK